MCDNRVGAGVVCIHEPPPPPRSLTVPQTTGASLLHIAARRGRTEVAALLLNKGVDVNQENNVSAEAEGEQGVSTTAHSHGLALCIAGFLACALRCAGATTQFMNGVCLNQSKNVGLVGG